MSYTLEQRLAIGKEIYDGELTRYEAAKKYDICEESARRYMRLYRDTNQLPPKRATHKRCLNTTIPEQTKSANLETYASMTKEELIEQLVEARIREARLKKGYEVKGDGSIIRYTNKSTR